MFWSKGKAALRFETDSFYKSTAKGSLNKHIWRRNSTLKLETEKDVMPNNQIMCSSPC